MDDVWRIDQWGRIYNRYTMVARDLSFENHTLSLGFGVVFDDKSLQPWYNYYKMRWGQGDHMYRKLTYITDMSKELFIRWLPRFPLVFSTGIWLEWYLLAVDHDIGDQDILLLLAQRGVQNAVSRVSLSRTTATTFWQYCMLWQPFFSHWYTVKILVWRAHQIGCASNVSIHTPKRVC